MELGTYVKGWSRVKVRVGDDDEWRLGLQLGLPMHVAESGNNLPTLKGYSILGDRTVSMLSVPGIESSKPRSALLFRSTNTTILCPNN